MAWINVRSLACRANELSQRAWASSATVPLSSKRGEGDSGGLKFAAIVLREMSFCVVQENVS